MTADVEENDLTLLHGEDDDDSVGVRETRGVLVSVFSFELVEPELRNERVRLELLKHVLEYPGQVWMSSQE